MMVFSSELQRLETDRRDHLHRVFEEYAKRRSQLDSERRKLEKLVVATEMERENLEREKEKVRVISCVDFNHLLSYAE